MPTTCGISGFCSERTPKEVVLEARRPDATEFDQGMRMAYYSVISLMQDQARTFALPLADLAFEDFDPDRDILSNQPVTTEPRDRRLAAATDALMRAHERRGRASWWTVRRFLRAGRRRSD